MDLVTVPVLAGVRITAADHPSLDTGVARFADEVKAEPRCFGRPGGLGPKPFPSLIARVCSRESGFRIAALHEGRVVGLARVDDDGEVFIVVVAAARGRGVGLALARAMVERARDRGCRRLVLRSSRRSRAAVALAESLGFIVVDAGRGRIELILDLVRAA
ncbi:MAG TPA: GNAT family N-acetyltransferase [Ilumatobacteraceae bacterium]|nr:GNAT family N-acetyltransferase [Ilumatobacteraceae bacterium]